MLLFYTFTSALFFFIVFFPDIFPRCASCRKIKFRASFRVHGISGVGLGYSKQRSVCRKCCMKYNIETLGDYKRIDDIRRKIEAGIKTGGKY
jgi:hypothetical protein